jgi:hypothetical protein
MADNSTQVTGWQLYVTLTAPMIENFNGNNPLRCFIINTANEREGFHMNQKSIIALILGVAITIGTLIFVIVLIGDTAAEPQIDIKGPQLVISKGYKATIELSGAAVTMELAVPTILRRNNGTSINNIHRGYFSVTGVEGNVYLNISDITAPCILIITSEGKRFYINRNNESDTIKLYHDILSVIG